MKPKKDSLIIAALTIIISLILIVGIFKEAIIFLQ